MGVKPVTLLNNIMGKTDIRKYISLVEQYNNLINYPAGSVLMPNMPSSDPYLHYRMSINLANEDQDLENNESRENAVFIFFTQQAKDAALKLFKDQKEPHKDLTSMKSQEESWVQKVSPVPSDRFAKKKK